MLDAVSFYVRRLLCMTIYVVLPPNTVPSAFQFLVACSNTVIPCLVGKCIQKFTMFMTLKTSLRSTGSNELRENAGVIVLKLKITYLLSLRVGGNGVKPSPGKIA